jgi:hypothetical protein
MIPPPTTATRRAPVTLALPPKKKIADTHTRRDDSARAPFAGITRIRYGGCDLSPPFGEHPIASTIMAVTAGVKAAARR